MPRAPMPRPTAWPRAALAALFMAFALTALAPDNAAAQAPAASLNLGTVGDFNLNLTDLVTAGDKHYYYLDHSNTGTGDGRTRTQLQSLLNSDSVFGVTQEGTHTGNDDERSVIVGSYALILPTLMEFQALYGPPNLVSSWSQTGYHVAENLLDIDLGGNGASSTISVSQPRRVAFQVITLPPAAPTGVMLTPGDGQITVMWTAVSDTSTPTLTYTNTATATDTTDASNTFTCNANSRTETDCTIDSLANGTTYSVAVVTTNNHGTSTPSAALMSAPVATAQPTHQTLSLGTHEDINLNLILPVILNDDTPDTADDKLYYYVDRNENGTTNETDDSHVRDGDAFTGDMVDALFNSENNGADVFATHETDTALLGAPGNHDGMPDERSIKIGNYIVVLPTANELHALSVDQGNRVPTGWAPRDYRTATRSGSDTHRLYFFHGSSVFTSDINTYRLVVQVIPLAVSAPTAPTAVTASPVTATALRINWVAVPDDENGGATILTYTATATPASTFSGDAATCTDDGTTIATTITPDGPISTITCTIMGLTTGTPYEIKVTATNSVGDSDPSDSVTVIPGTPAAPTVVTLDPGFEKIVVTWTPVPAEDNGGVDIISYTATPFLSPEGGTEGPRLRDNACTTPDAATYTCTITGLTNGNRYRVIVQATNSRGDSIASLSIYNTLSGVFRTTDTIRDQTFSVDQPDATINLPAATEGIGPYTYILTRSDGDTPLLPSGLAFDPVARTISGTPSAAYGTNGGIELVYTATDSDTPTPDSGTLTFRLTVNDDALRLGRHNGIDLNLRYPVTVGGKNYYYNDHNNNGTAERTFGGNTGDDVSPSNLRSLLNGGSPIPETPDAQRSVTIGAYTLVLPTINEMKQLRSHPPAGRSPTTWNNATYHTATGSGTDSDGINIEGHRYFSFNNGTSFVGLGVSWPVAFQVIIAATAPTAAPTGVTALPTTTETLRIAWTPVPTRDNGGARILTYTATATPAGTFTGAAATCTADGANADNCDISDLTNDTIYSITVAATNSVGVGTFTSTPFTVIPGRPAAPAGVTLMPGDMEIMVTWTAVPDGNDGGNDVTSYTAYPFLSPDGGTEGPRLDANACTTPDAATTNCTIMGLTNGNRYRVVVYATNGRGDSIASSGAFETPMGDLGLTLTPGALTMDEGGTATYTAVLGTLPTDTVTVTVSGFSGTALATTPPSPPTLTFTTTNWNAPQTFTLTAAEDADAADETPVTLMHTAAGGGYDAATGTVMVTVIDNDLVFNPNTIEDQRHNINEALTLLLPEATGGVGVVTYSLVRPPATEPQITAIGLTFEATTHTIIGVPTSGFGPATLEYTAADSASAKTGTLTFSFRVTPVPALTLTPAALTFAEGSTTTYTAVLTSQPTADVTVAIAGHTGTDLTVMTPSAGMLTFTMTNWDAAQTVTLTAAEDADAVDETPVTLGHTVTSTDTDYDSLTRQDLSVTITDDDTAALTLTPGALTFDEGGTANYTVVLDTEPTVPVTVTITGHATTDLTVMTPDSSMLMFDATNWETPQTVTLTAGEDTDTPEENDTVTLTHTAAGGEYDNVTGDVTVTIMDNDVPGLITPRSLTVVEGAAATYPVRLTIAPEDDVTVAITVPVGGVGLDDWTTILTFTTMNFDEPQNVVITTRDNDIDAMDEDVILAHTATSSGNYMSGVAVRNLALTIADNDTRGLTLTPGALTFDEGGTATYTAVLDSEPTANVTVTVAIDNTDVTTIPTGDGFVFEPGNWDTPQTLTFTAAEDDDLMDDSATLTHTIRGGDYTGLDAVVLGVTVTDNDIDFNPDTIEDQTHNIHQPLTLPLPEATNGVGTVTYSLVRTPAANSQITAIGLTFEATTHTIIGVPTSGFGPATLEYTAADSASAKTGTLTFTLRVVDERGITLNPTTVTMDEGGTATYTVALTSTPSEAVTVTISGHDADGSDSANDLAIMSPASGTLIFDQMNWNIEQTVTLTADRDMEAMGTDEMNDTVTLTHTASGGDYTGLPAVTADLVVNITDTGAPNLLLLPTSLMLTEGGTGTYTVGLTTSPDAAVTVTVGGFTSTDDVTPTPTVLTFTTGNWNTPQTVIIDVAEDDDAVVDATVTLTHTVASSGNYMTGVAVRNLSVTIDENDTVGLNLMPTSLTLAEGNTATYTAVLDSVPTADVTVTVDGFIGTDVTPTPTVLTFTTTEWSTAQTFTITAAEDSDTVDEDPVTLMHTAEGGDYTAARVTAALTVTIIDDDDTTRGPLMLSPDTVADRIYPLSETVRIPPLTLPEASGGQPPYIYTLTRGGGVLGPNGFNFAAPPSTPTIAENGQSPPNATNVTAAAPIIISGLPNQEFGGAGGADLVYTVTDSTNPNNPVATLMLTFNVRVVPVTLTNSGGAEPVTDEDGTALAINNVGMDNGDMKHNLRLFLPDGHGVTTVTVNTYTPTAGTEPTDYTFSGVAMDIDLTPASEQSITTGEATVCLSTTGVPTGHQAALLLANAEGTPTSWAPIGTDTTTRPDFVCGTTSNFAPYFAVASMSPTSVTPPGDVNAQELSFASTVADRIYPANVPIPTLILPKADGGITPLTYTLDGDLATLSFTFAPDTRTLVGTPTAAALASLTYTVTDSTTPNSQAAFLTFSVSVVAVTVGGGGTFEAVEDGTVLAVNDVGGGGQDNNNDVRLSLPDGGLTAATTFTVTTYTPPADPVPAGYILSGVAVDIDVSPSLSMAANVCLSTADVPDDHTPALLHYNTPPGGTVMWSDITNTAITRTGFVCGTTATFSPLTVVSTPTPSITLTPTTLMLAEGGTATYTVVLDTEPIDTVTVTIDSSNTYVITTPTVLTFTNTDTTGTWNMAQTVTLTDNDDTARNSATLTHTADGGNYNDVTAELTVTDNLTPTDRLNEQILSRASQAMTASVSARVAARVEAAASSGGINGGGAGDPSALAYQFGGQSSMRDLLQAHGKTMLEGEMDYARLLEGASFVLPLSAAGDEGGGKLGGLSLWGSSDFSNLDGDADDLDWDGEIVSFNLGVDAPVGRNMLAGLALSLNNANFDYTDYANEGQSESGDYEYYTTNLHPYFGYMHNDKLNFWGAAGFGEGEIEIKADADDAEKKTDTTHLSLAGGFSNQIARAPGRLPGSVTTLSVKSDASVVQVDVEKDETAGFASQEIDSHHVRLLMSGEHRRELAGGGSLAPSGEVGVRYEGGDGETDSGIEIGAGLRYADPSGKLTLAGNVRGMLLDDYDAWGADFTVRLLPQSGRGLSLSLQPVWGQTQSTAERLWDDGAGELGGGDTALQSRMDSEVGYGLAATMLGSTGVLTPYAGMTTADGGVSHVRLGGRFAGGDGLSLKLEGARGNGDDASHTVLLRGELAF